MAFLFKSTPKTRTPQELVAYLSVELEKASGGVGDASARAKSIDGVGKALLEMKQQLYGDGTSEPNAETGRQIAEAVFAGEAMGLLIRGLPNLGFEARKDVAHIFKHLMQRQSGQKRPGPEYMADNPTLLITLLDGYTNPETALTSGSMLRECIKHESLATDILHADEFYCLFQYIELPNFDVASDAFVVFKDLVTVHKNVCAEFLFENYDQVFDSYTLLLNSENYVTRRQSLKLLGELLLDRKNFSIMTRYIASTENMKLMMNLLRDKSKSIQFEAFHVFKVFVANPHKPEPIKQILLNNKDKLIKYLSNFQNDRDDEQFKEEKAFLIREVGKVTAGS